MVTIFQNKRKIMGPKNYNSKGQFIPNKILQFKVLHIWKSFSIETLGLESRKKFGLEIARLKDST